MSQETLVFVTYHTQAMLDTVPTLPGFQKVLLPGLVTNPASAQANAYAENRLFLSDLAQHIPDYVRYIGCVNARAQTKYDWQRWSWEKFADILSKTLAPGIVVAPWVTDRGGPAKIKDWVQQSEGCHPGMGKLLREMAELTKMELLPNRRTIWANNFVAEVSVWQQFLEFFRTVFSHFDGKYGPNLRYGGGDPSRKPAFFYERVTCHYFAHRPDLNIVCTAFPDEGVK